MSQFKRVKPAKQPKLETHAESVDHQLWSKYKPTYENQYFGKIADISFSDGAPYDMAVSTSTRVHIYDMSTQSVKKTVTRFQTPVNCSHIRDDGQTLVAGSDDGLVQVFDLNSRAIIRSFPEHKAAVYSTKFIGDGTRVLTASQDKTAKIFDVPTATLLYDITAHEDSVRCAIQSALSPDIVITASYDHKVNFHDLRSDTFNTPTLSFDHGAPISSLVMSSSSGAICTAGDSSTKVWSVFDQSTCQANFTHHHQKEITSLALSKDGKHMLSGSLDSTIKVYDVGQLKAIHTINVGAPVLSLAFAPDSSTIATGTPQGLLKILRRRMGSKDKALAPQVTAALQKKTSTRAPKIVAKMSARAQHFFRGASYQGTNDDQHVQIERAQYLRPFESKLRMFQYGPALDEVIRLNDPNVASALIEELALRHALPQALQNRDDTSLEPILKFVVKNITGPTHSSAMVILANAVLDAYTDVIGNSAVLDNLFMKLFKRLDNELNVQNEYTKMIGELQLIFSTSGSK